MKKSVKAILFNQNTPLSHLVEVIRGAPSSGEWVLLSSHMLFPPEKQFLEKQLKVPLSFKTFADYLNDAEMALCDQRAFEVDVKLHGDPRWPPDRYYSLIKEEKNRIILKKFTEEYELQERILCANDLGIDESVWYWAGFANKKPPAGKIKATDPTIPARKKNRETLLGLGTMANRWEELPVVFARTARGVYCFLGKPIRIKQYWPDMETIDTKPFRQAVWDALRVLKWRRAKWSGHDIQMCLCEKLIRRIEKKHGVLSFLTTMHEYTLEYAELAARYKRELIVMQDGYLPENYSSKYCFYYWGVSKFWVWDRLSMGLFDNQQLKVEVCPFLRAPKLPRLPGGDYPVHTILVLSSGAGDWTALKNRSDEDRMILSFVEVARQFPDLQIIYRCHPLWAHKEHQGLHSIERVDAYFKSLGLSNIALSGGSLVESTRFRTDGRLYVNPGSIESDFEKADLVFGDHSFSMIDAAKRGKLFASVNITGRRDFFYNYTKLGFLHCEGTAEIIGLIERIRTQPGTVIQMHNQAVENYNSKCS